MILVIDAGNTRIKWRWWSAGAWHAGGVATLADVGILASEVAEEQPSWVGVSCVAGEPTRRRLAQVLAALPGGVYWLSPRAEGHGLVNRYRVPETLGADRYAGLIGAVRLGYGPCVVVNAGTAVTIDALTAAGEFLGGLILPGIAIARASLAAGTAAIRDGSGRWLPYPRSTGDAVESGIREAVCGAIERMRARLSAEQAAEVRVVLSGGDAEGILPGVPAASVVDGLVMEGLLWIARDLGVPGA